MTLRSILLPIAVGAALFSACSAEPEPLDITMQAVEFRFEPSTVEVVAGQQITIRMENMGSVEHDFVIDEIPMEVLTSGAEPGSAADTGHAMGEMAVEPAVHMGAAAGMASSVTFVPTKPGSYEFYCAVPGHREAGMVGTLVVGEP